MRISTCSGFLGLALIVVAPGWAQQPNSIQNQAFTVSVRGEDGIYTIGLKGLVPSLLSAGVAAEIDYRWIRSAGYPRHSAVLSSFADVLGTGHRLVTTFSGLNHEPNLICVLRLYDQHPYGDVSVVVRNTTSKLITVQAIRVVEAHGEPRINLGGPQAADRVLAESFSENPPVRIGSLAQAPSGDYVAVRSELIYNLHSRRNVLLAALTSKRFLTVFHLKVASLASGALRIASFTCDSTGGTDIVSSIYAQISPQQQIDLSLPVAPGQSLPSERVMFAAGRDYFHELEEYGEAIRHLHHARVSGPSPMGWWSWSAFYGGITQGDVLTNAECLSKQLPLLGYKWLLVDEGYEYARGEYTAANATQFPYGMWSLGHAICGLGLKFAVWTAPFEVSARAWVYRHHRDWLVKDARGKPIRIGLLEHTDPLYVLDTTNPGAQAYLRQTYQILTRQWGVRCIKLDFMCATTIEGYRYRPNTTALEAQQIGLKIIRQAVGPDVLLDKDGSPMLNPVGLVDEGRISTDRGHSFRFSKRAAWNIAARFYMNRTFYVSDPDAFCVSRQVIPQQKNWHESLTPMTLNEAQTQIVLSAVAGGMYEIGDDLPTLASEPERLALVENRELINMKRLGKAALPLDLMTFPSKNMQPSVFFLQEDRRQAMLAVFNWAEQPHARKFALASLGLPTNHPFQAYDVLNHDAPVQLSGGVLRLENQPPHSVRLIKLVDTSVAAAPPSVMAQVPLAARAGELVKLSASAEVSAVPALSYHWDFGDGTSASGAEKHHTYTRAGTFPVQLAVRGLDGLAYHQHFTITVTGFPNAVLNLRRNRRYVEETNVPRP